MGFSHDVYLAVSCHFVLFDLAIFFPLRCPSAPVFGSCDHGLNIVNMS